MTPDPISPPSDGQPSSAAQGSDQLLDEVYTRLDHLVASSGVEDEYIARLRTVLSAALASERAGFPITLLPLLTCRAAGTAMEPALPVAAAWRALLIAAKLLDDVEDGDVTRMSADTTNPPQVINLATGFLAIAGLALSQLPPATWFVLQADLNRTILHAASGQHVDLSRGDTAGLEEYFRVIAAKSGACFAFAARAGAQCGTSDPATVARYDQFGYNVGVVIQLADDLAGLRAPGDQGDLATGQRTLPVRYALAVASPSERVRLEELLVRALTDPEAELQARHLIVALGAEVYLLAELARYYRRALAAFESFDTSDSAIQPLYTWLVAINTGTAPGPPRAQPDHQ